jgi:hypothetical protein
MSMESRCWREIWLVRLSAMVLKEWREPRARRVAHSLTMLLDFGDASLGREHLVGVIAEVAGPVGFMGVIGGVGGWLGCRVWGGG